MRDRLDRSWNLDAHPRPLAAGNLTARTAKVAILDACSRPLDVRYPRSKMLLDRVVAALLLLLLAPVLIGVAAMCRLSDGPGVIFRQRRVGMGGHEFTLLKFRSLTPLGPDESATRWNVRGDARISRWGRFLRRSSLDELPQLVNVLRGEMSLVGPRPERPHFVAEFTRRYGDYPLRHRMPVGLTGLAQVRGLRGDTSITERASCDNHYIDNWSALLDLWIMLRTPLAMVRSGG